ncbi:uncharacterized protein LOC124509886 [Lynx rufus]|uniref:uncharacterized protein LOC124509886 n=1 Tax=Lynx rufus TaxID=61384 RepID=UPI001F122F89|nr:uncharacterized protein LOC124509886 [Lynx rufus]
MVLEKLLPPPPPRHWLPGGRGTSRPALPLPCDGCTQRTETGSGWRPQGGRHPCRRFTWEPRGPCPTASSGGFEGQDLEKWTRDLSRKAWREVGASVTSVHRQARSPCAGEAPAEVTEAPGLSSLAGSPFPLGAVVQLSPGNVWRCRRDGNLPRCLTAALPPSSCLSSLPTSEVTGKGLGKGRRHIWGASRPARDGGGTGERCARIWPSVSWLCGLRPPVSRNPWPHGIPTGRSGGLSSSSCSKPNSLLDPQPSSLLLGKWCPLLPVAWPRRNKEERRLWGGATWLGPQFRQSCVTPQVPGPL